MNENADLDPESTEKSELDCETKPLKLAFLITKKVSWNIEGSMPVVLWSSQRRS